MPNQRKAKPDKDSADGISLYEAQRRRTLAQAKQEEIKARHLAGELIERETIRQEWLKTAAAIRNRLLAIPTKAAPVLLPLKALPAIQSTLQTLIHEALHDLSTHAFARPVDPGPATRTDGERMGGSAPEAES